MTIERLTYRSKQTSEAVQFLGGAAQALEIVAWANTLGATGRYLPGSSGTSSAAVPAREQRVRIGQTNPNAPTPAERSKSIIMDLVPGDWLVAVGRRLYKVDGAEFGALWERVDDDGQVTVGKEQLTQLFGKWGLPPWPNADGEYVLGGDVDCAALAQEILVDLEALFEGRSAASGADERVPDGDDEDGGDDQESATDDHSVDEVDDPEHEEDDGEEQEDEAHVGLMPPLPRPETFLETVGGLNPHQREGFATHDINPDDAAGLFDPTNEFVAGELGLVTDDQVSGEFVDGGTFEFSFHSDEEPDGQTLPDPDTGEPFEVSPGDFDAPQDER